MSGAGDRMLDNGLLALTTESDRVFLCAADPADYASANATHVGVKNGSRGSMFYPISTPIQGGRMASLSGFLDGDITSNGTANFVVVADSVNQNILITEVLAQPKAVKVGGKFSIATMDVILGSSSQPQAGSLIIGSPVIGSPIFTNKPPFANGITTASPFIGTPTFIATTTGWTNIPVTQQTAHFTCEFDAVPSAASIDNALGLSNGPASNFADVACGVSFTLPGSVIQVRNGGVYAADAVLAYTGGQKFHIRMFGDIGLHTYSVWATPFGQSEVQLANNYSFRTEQAAVTQLNNFARNATELGIVALSNLSLNSLLAVPFAVGRPTISSAVINGLTNFTSPPLVAGAGGTPAGAFNNETGTFTIQWDAVPSQAAEDVVMGISNGIPSDVFSTTCRIRFAATGIDAINNTIYASSIAVPYSAGVLYHFRAVVRIIDQTYDVYVTPQGQAEVQMANNFTFASEQLGTKQLNNLSKILFTGDATLSNMKSPAFADTAAFKQVNRTTTTLTVASPVFTRPSLVANAGGPAGAFNAQNGTFTIQWDAIPLIAAEDAVFGLTPGPGAPVNYSEFACTARFAPSGNIDSYNATVYTAALVLPYSAGTSYHFRMVVRIASHTYDVFVTPQGQGEITLASNYAFRSEQAAATTLSYLGKLVLTGDAQLSNMIGPPVVPQVPVVNNSTFSEATTGASWITGALVGTMTAQWSPTSWTITAGNGLGYFAIDNSGNITVTSAGVTGLGGASGTIALTVRATNSFGNGTGTATINYAPASAFAGAFGPRTTDFQISFDASPTVANANVVFGLSSSAPSADTDFACRFKFAPRGPSLIGPTARVNIDGSDFGMPNAATTGPKAGIVLTNYVPSGAIPPGSTIQNKIITGGIDLSFSPNAILRNCIVYAAAGYLTNCIYAGNTYITVDHCRLVGNEQSANGILGCGIFTNNDISHMALGIQISVGPVKQCTVKDSWIHDLYFYPPPPTNPEGTHWDAILNLGDTTMCLIEHNYCWTPLNGSFGGQGGGTSAIFISQQFANIDNVTIRNNLLHSEAGGTFQLGNGANTLSNILVELNYVERGYYDYVINNGNMTNYTYRNNVEWYSGDDAQNPPAATAPPYPTNNFIKACNGYGSTTNVFGANNPCQYTSGAIYHFRVVVRISNHTFDVYVTPPGGSEILLADTFAFSTEQATNNSLGYLGKVAVSGDATLTNMVVV